ncbi:MAG: uvrC [Gammaproteobacteria bacterium]|nr:uvrC [Gammaproteobacteria bacterium]
MTEFDHKSFCRTLTQLPGIYRMLDADGKVIYVGKAANLKKRVSSYFSKKYKDGKTASLVRQIQAIAVTVTNTQGEALLLESNLIKELKPRYNIVFRDDKSYPYIHLSLDHPFPRLSFYRGARKHQGRYFGPYPGAGAARQTLNLAQKIFQIRPCNDTFFQNRSRPCLQYQIKRCSAPCVGIINKTEYAEAVQHGILFLDGKNETVIRVLTGPMQKAADIRNYERAAHYRDQIIALRKIQEQQHINSASGEMDIIGCSIAGGLACIQVFVIRNGCNLGNQTIYPSHGRDADCAEVIGAFLSQYYLGRDRYIPPELLLSHQPQETRLISQGLSQQAGRKVRLSYRLRGERAKWVKLAVKNAEVALQQRIASKEGLQARFTALRDTLKLEDVPTRIECFDISHTGGEATVASCVVYGQEGAIKSAYRRFNIVNIKAGDDYGAMRQVIERRYTRIRKEEGVLPDLVLVDGGAGQVNAAKAVMQELQLEHIPILGIAKGSTRKPGLETLILSNINRVFSLAPASPVLHLIQEIRDEAHRFAITGHRQARGNKRNHSPLEQIEGVGSKRRQQLLRHFGGIQGVERAGIEDLVKVPGINKNLATKIYHSLHHQTP